MSETLRIREMTPLDRAAWIEMYSDLFPDRSVEAMGTEVDRVLHGENRAGYCAEQGDEMLGFAEYNLREFANGCVSQPVPFLEGIWVKETARGKGVARALVEHLFSIARAAGYREIGSDVLLDDASSSLMHDALGFEETERVIFYRKAL